MTPRAFPADPPARRPRSRARLQRPGRPGPPRPRAGALRRGAIARRGGAAPHDPGRLPRRARAGAPAPAAARGPRSSPASSPRRSTGIPPAERAFRRLHADVWGGNVVWDDARAGRSWTGSTPTSATPRPGARLRGRDGRPGRRRADRAARGLRRPGDRAAGGRLAAPVRARGGRLVRGGGGAGARRPSSPPRRSASGDRLSAGDRGSRTSNRPPDGEGTSRRVPPQRSAVARAIGSPRPAPGAPRRSGAR